MSGEDTGGRVPVSEEVRYRREGPRVWKIQEGGYAGVETEDRGGRAPRSDEGRSIFMREGNQEWGRKTQEGR